MRNRIPSLCLCCLLCLVAFLTPLAADEPAPLTAKEVRKALRKADKALEAGRSAEALPLYRQILTSTEPGDPSRPGALYAVAFDALAGRRDDVPVRAYLEELLGKFPRHRPQEVHVALTWLRQRSDVAKLSEALATEQAARAETSGQEEELRGLVSQVAEMSQELESTRQALAATKKELEAAKAELAKKDEAIKKLRDALVRSGG